MNHLPHAWGRPRDDVYGAYDPSYLPAHLGGHHAHAAAAGPTQHTQQPIVTGTSVLAVKFRDGIVMAADNLASYGSLARFSDVKRLLPFAGTTVVGVGGDVSDMQYLSRLLTSLDIRESYHAAPVEPTTTATATATAAPSSSDDADVNATATATDDHEPARFPRGPHLNAQNVHTYLSKVLYKRRSDFNPLWNQILVGGFDGAGVPFLASVDLLGTTFAAPTMATGYGAQLALPLLRKLIPDERDVAAVSAEQAVAAVRAAMKVLFYRDARSWDRYSLAVLTAAQGLRVVHDQPLEGQSWAFADLVRGYGTQVN
ncbi:MAG: Proteasome subunit beta type-7 [Phylliscum demangeonii]|nr:MAG: Proteasome subunit beta type-7 [Phylliscum demangeonii]